MEDLDQGIFLQTMTVVEILVFPVMILVAAAERRVMVERCFFVVALVDENLPLVWVVVDP